MLYMANERKKKKNQDIKKEFRKMHGKINSLLPIKNELPKICSLNLHKLIKSLLA